MIIVLLETPMNSQKNNKAMKYFNKTILFFIAVILTSCVQEVHLKTVTFIVDMNAIEQPTSVGVRGNFTTNSWNELIFLTDDNKDGIYEVTVSEKTAVNQIEFKFVNAENEYELKGFNNRVIPFEYKPETITYEAVFNNQEEKITKN